MIRFRTGWWIPGRVIALTHFEREVAPSTQQQIFSEVRQLLLDARGPFDLLIDNRNMNMTRTVPLTHMLAAVPELNHPLLSKVVVVVPATLVPLLDSLEVEQVGEVSLFHVATLEQGLEVLGGTSAETAPDFFRAGGP